jgi:precorrin-6B methylase 2
MIPSFNHVVQIIEALYEEQEQDDREMYNLSMQTVRETTKCELSEIVEELNANDFRRLLTYGEVSAESISQTVLPLLKLEADDVFYDLGCGTGKIVVQVAMQTPCMVAKGIELMQNRVREGAKALERLEDMKLPVLNDKEVRIVQGDILKPPAAAPVMDATVVFINNVCFTPELMLKVLDVLSSMPRLKRVVTLRKICVRHRPLKCARANNFCVDYVQPPEEAEIKVSWAHKTSVYLYERVDFALTQLAEQL